MARLHVVPRRLTLGVYVHALAEAGADEGEAWLAVDPVVSFAVLDALCEEVRMKPNQLLGVAQDQWDTMMRAYNRAVVLADRAKQEVQKALLEALPPPAPTGRYKILRMLGTLPPTERAAALSEPLSLSLVFGYVGAVQRQFDEVQQKAIESSIRKN